MRRPAFALTSALFVGACPSPPPPPPFDVPCGVTTLEQAEPAIFVPQNNIQIVLEGGDTCTPGVGAECEEAFAACDIGFGDVAVGDIARRSFLVRAEGSFLTINQMRITGACSDVYLEGPPLLDVSIASTQTVGVTVVVTPTREGPCTAQLEIASDATNTDDFDEFGRGVIAVDVVVNGVAGGAEGCAPDIACCCGGAAGPSGRQPVCSDDDRLTCNDFEAMFFGARCDFECAASETEPWLRRSDDAFTAGPVQVDRDVVVLHPEPCIIERIDRAGVVVWTNVLSLLPRCDDVALAGDVLIVTADGVEALLDASDGDGRSSSANPGRTVIASMDAVPGIGPAGAVAASVRGDDVVVRTLDATGGFASSFDVVGVAPEATATQQHFIAPLASGDVVLAFVRPAGALPVEVGSVDGGAFSLDDAAGTTVLQLDGAGLARRAFVVHTARVAGLAAQGEAFVMCGGTDEAGALVELSPVGEPAVELAPFDASRSFLLHVDAVGDASFQTDPNSNVYTTCALDPSGAPFALATSNTSFALRTGLLERTLMTGRAVAWGALLDEDAIVVVGSHGGIAGQDVLPLYPPGLAPFDSGSFVYRVPLVELGLE